MHYPHAITLRTSTVGPGLNTQYGLLEWFFCTGDAVDGVVAVPWIRPGSRGGFYIQYIGILASVYLVEIPLWSSPNKAGKVSISKMTVLAQTKLTGFKNNMPGYYHAA